MAQWLRFQHQGKNGLGQVQGDQIAVYEGDLFNGPKATGETIKLSDVTIDIPCTPSKMVAMVDNFHALVTNLNMLCQQSLCTSSKAITLSWQQTK